MPDWRGRNWLSPFSREKNQEIFRGRRRNLNLTRFPRARMGTIRAEFLLADVSDVGINRVGCKASHDWRQWIWTVWRRERKITKGLLRVAMKDSLSALKEREENEFRLFIIIYPATHEVLFAVFKSATSWQAGHCKPIQFSTSGYVAACEPRSRKKQQKNLTIINCSACV